MIYKEFGKAKTNKKKIFSLAITVLAVCILTGCFQILVSAKSSRGTVTQGKSSYREFQVDNILHSSKNGDIHYHVYFPDSYDGKKKMALYVTLPGYQGLYFQGVAENLKTEDFAFEAKKYNKDMIILAPQLNDWEETSANQTIALVEYFLDNYPIDASKVYINGYSGGGETLSLVLEKRPELFARALMCSSQWEGKYQPTVKAKTPVYFVIGESDEYYTSKPFRNAYQKLHDLYQKRGLSEKEIKNLLVLDVKDSAYFEGTGVTYQHGGGGLFCRDKKIMNWLFSPKKTAAKKTNDFIALNKTAYTLNLGKTVRLKAALSRAAKKKGVKWKSSNPKVASVSQRGKVTAKKTGTATITARIKGTKVKASSKITVKAPTDKGTSNKTPSSKKVTKDMTVSEIIRDPAFGDFGRLLFPVDRAVSGDMTLAEISNSNVYIWYSNIRAEKTVEIVNDLKSRSEDGEQVFYRIYSEKEINADPEKRDTGLFYFKGKPGEKYAILNAGGGFAYVGAMHDSFPHALEVSKKGYHAFALIYRPDSAYEDLAQAIQYVHDHAEELGVDTEDYSLWGGSAGARMAATLGNAEYGPANYGRPDIPQASAVIMQYTGYTNASRSDAPTYACVGTRDGIADYRTMETRLAQLSAFGIPTEFHAYEGLSHGFGLGTGTVAEGWIEDAIAFWEAQAET